MKKQIQKEPAIAKKPKNGVAASNF